MLVQRAGWLRFNFLGFHSNFICDLTLDFYLQYSSISHLPYPYSTSQQDYKTGLIYKEHFLAMEPVMSLNLNCNGFFFEGLLSGKNKTYDCQALSITISYGFTAEH